MVDCGVYSRLIISFESDQSMLILKLHPTKSNLCRFFSFLLREIMNRCRCLQPTALMLAVPHNYTNLS